MVNPRWSSFAQSVHYRCQTNAKATFAGSGVTLSGRPAATTPASTNAAAADDDVNNTIQPDQWASLSGGAKLSTGRGDRIGGGVAAPIEVMDDEDDDEEGSDGSGFDGFPDDDDAIVIDSD